MNQNPNNNKIWEFDWIGSETISIPNENLTELNYRLVYREGVSPAILIAAYRCLLYGSATIPNSPSEIDKYYQQHRYPHQSLDSVHVCNQNCPWKLIPDSDVHLCLNSGFIHHCDSSNPCSDSRLHRCSYVCRLTQIHKPIVSDYGSAGYAAAKLESEWNEAENSGIIERVVSAESTGGGSKKALDGDNMDIDDGPNLLTVRAVTSATTTAAAAAVTTATTKAAPKMRKNPSNSTTAAAAAASSSSQQPAAGAAATSATAAPAPVTVTRHNHRQVGTDQLEIMARSFIHRILKPRSSMAATDDNDESIAIAQRNSANTSDLFSEPLMLHWIHRYILYFWYEISRTKYFISNAGKYRFNHHCQIIVENLITGFKHKDVFIIPISTEIVSIIPSVSDIDFGANYSSHGVVTRARKFFRMCIAELLETSNESKVIDNLSKGIPESTS